MQVPQRVIRSVADLQWYGHFVFHLHVLRTGALHHLQIRIRNAAWNFEASIVRLTLVSVLWLLERVIAIAEIAGLLIVHLDHAATLTITLHFQ